MEALALSFHEFLPGAYKEEWEQRESPLGAEGVQAANCGAGMKSSPLPQDPLSYKTLHHCGK